MTIEEFYKKANIMNPTYGYGNAKTIEDFYNDFIASKDHRIEDKFLIGWHNLLKEYYEKTENPVFFVRKYESKKSGGKWDTRRGAVVRFNHKIEIVYSSNFLAHDIYLMALNGFVPTLNDFSHTVKNRKLRNTIGTASDRLVTLYPGNNKTLHCYLAHIIGVNCDQYKRNSGQEKTISKAESNLLFPLGDVKNWGNKEHIYDVKYDLSDEQIDILKAHSMRLLNPLNYFLTPQTKNIKHAVVGLKKNIGEYGPLINYVIETRKKDYPQEFVSFLNLGRYCDYKYCKADEIHLEYDIHKTYKTKALSKPVGGKPKGVSSSAKTFTPSIVFNGLSKTDFINEFLKRGYAFLEIEYLDGHKDTKEWHCSKFSDSSDLIGNLRSKGWYRQERDLIKQISCRL